MEEYEAIFKRKSVRKYLDEPITVAELDEIIELTKYPKSLYDVDLEIHVVEEGKIMHNVLKGIIGSYGKILAPHYLIATSEIKEGYLENVGYALEHIVLKMTEMGIGTCYIGGFFNKELVRNIINIKENQVPVIVVAFGYPSKGMDYIKMIVGSKRMNLESFCFGNFEKTWKFIMDAVRLSPSSMNSQPWRFFKEDGIVDVYIKDGKKSAKMIDMNKIDIGIALQHLKIAADYFDKKIEFKKIENRCKDGLIYVISVIER